ncbi:non-hydrolyzing UDP-N-acetylglucosamine 2-epimerase [Kitasatospora sp. MMS16-BH015]|uniref:non-hydrolyzing UDP-N-acetylglucosamine 2-epimerase n=1 Tax=Kitasatospora sp. MMS16-BH015 TaxID=2018025 RepID=UPI000CF22A5C|nr:UDP-N-acetylglucosamine 2-epimerase (non-hydrolyzing) [Kitasatospora sp. MMS16-BH015]
MAAHCSPRIAVVVGTRPEIVKVAHIVRELGDRGYLVNTGQHYDHDMSGTFLNGLPKPELVLDGVGAQNRSRQFARIIEGLGTHFAHQPPAAVIVQGDTNTAAAGAQAAHFAGIPVIHVEAGLRSRDRAMPEEINRMLVGVLADWHCAPTRQDGQNLMAEGVDPNRIMLTGNTIVEATWAATPGSDERTALLTQYGLEADQYVLATIHRPENTDDPERLAAILTQFAKLPLPVLFAAHPRTRAAAVRHGLQADFDRLSPSGPLDHRTYLALASSARLLISDSGGLQEETTVLKKPLIVVRNSTERPESITAGFAHLVQPGPAISRTAETLLADIDLKSRLMATPSPYGDGLASSRIAALARGYLV